MKSSCYLVFLSQGLYGCQLRKTNINIWLIDKGRLQKLERYKEGNIIDDSTNIKYTLFNV